MVSNYYKTSEVAQITGFTIRQLDYWARQEILVPSIQQSHGPGTRRLYSFEDIVKLRFIRQIKHQGWSIQKIREAISRLRDIIDNPDPLTSVVLVHGKRTILAICKTKEGERVLIDTLDASGQQVMWIVLEALQEETLRMTHDPVYESVSANISSE